MTSENVILEVKDFSVNYGYGQESVRAVTDVNFVLGLSLIHI